MNAIRRFAAARAWLIALILLLGSALAQADDAPWQLLPTSPILSALRAKVEAGDHSAVAAFWADAAKRTTPIIEPIANDTQHVIVTFVWRAAPPTTGVVLVAQLARTRDPMEGAM